MKTRTINTHNYPIDETSVKGADKESFNKTLRRLRKEHGFTQRSFGARVGVSPQAVSRWERGEDTPSLGRKRLISQVLGLSLGEAEFASEEMILAPLLSRDSLRFVRPGWIFENSLDLIKIVGPGIQLPRSSFRLLDPKYPPYCVEIEGDALDFAGINDNDLAVVSPREEPEQGALCFVSCYRMVSFKYLYNLSNGTVCLRSDAGDVRLSVNEQRDAEFCVHGVVVAIIKGRPRLRPF